MSRRLTGLGRVAVALAAVCLLPACADEGGEESPPEESRESAPSRAKPSLEPRGREPNRRRRPRPARRFQLPGPPPEAKTARVESVTDGDTIVLSATGRSRLIGVDTPEVHGGHECYGREASGFTARLLPPGTRVRYLVGTERRDRYGRSLVYVWLPGGRFLNAVLVLTGYAVPLTIAPNVDHADLFVRLGRSARRRGRGLWSPQACGGSDDRPARGSAPRRRRSRAGPAPAGDRDCGDFSSQQEAQDYYRSRGGPEHDPERLDADGDGRACESLP